MELRTLQGTKKTTEQNLEEVQQRLELRGKDMEDEQQKSKDLNKRCMDLSSEVEKERKLKCVQFELYIQMNSAIYLNLTLLKNIYPPSPYRMAAERELKPKAARREKLAISEDSGGGLNNADSAMLDMTLSMLRCSVCRDRFKDTCLTRCMHLFCKECIGGIVGARSRKCPMCGDKFGENDVKTVFFGAV